MIITRTFLVYGFCFLLSFVLSHKYAWGQYPDNFRKKNILISSDTIHIDTLSVIPGTLKVKNLDTSDYKINYIESRLILRKNLSPKPDSLFAEYKVFPYLFGKTYQHKNYNQIINQSAGIYNPFLFGNSFNPNDIFKTEGLTKSGSISRGISIGNNQNVVLNSNLNLQLSGKISEDIEVLAAVTDDNIPIQPDGNTQQLQDFDKVYIQLFNKQHKLQAGDFDLNKPAGYFMNFFKRSQGGYYKGTYQIPSFSGKKNVGSLITEAAGAIARGRFTRNTIPIEEGNQGPYRLRGMNNETYIIVISGSERVFLNGELLIRGQQNDYVIDYNTAEIVFMPKRLITKDNRIIVEFEYSDRNFARTLFFSGTEYTQKRFTARLNMYSEQDNKNQPLQQNLTDKEKSILSRIGDKTDSALVFNFQSVPYNRAQIQYTKKDTMVSGIKDTIFVFTRDSNLVLYNVSFSRVGQGNGSYVYSKNNTANGRVFEWVGPKKGEYEPVLLLATPKQTQMFTLGTDYRFSSASVLSVEAVTTKNDINLLSAKDKANDQGYGLRASHRFSRYLNKADTVKSWKLNTYTNYEYTSVFFNPIERYRDVEFTRDWNTATSTKKTNEYLPAAVISLSQSKIGNVSYQFKSYSKEKEYTGNMHGLQSQLALKSYRLTTTASYLQSKDSALHSNFLKHKADFSKQTKYVVVGVKEENETNTVRNALNDSLSNNSFLFQEYHAYVSSHDSSVNTFLLNVNRRYDYLTTLNAFKQVSKADNVNFTLELRKNPNSKLLLNTMYRSLSVTDTQKIVQRSGSTFLNRADYYLGLLKGSVTSSTFYEIGTGQEFKKDYVFIETAMGQGSYIWNDYNKNGAKELNEFEIAAFQNQANHIKIFVPSNEKVRSYSNILNEVLTVSPASYWRNAKGTKGFINRFSNQVLLRLERKTLDDNIENLFNPFSKGASDTALVENSNFRNSLFFNRNNSYWGMDYIHQETNNKQFLVNGFELRKVREDGLHFRWNITRVWGFKNIYTEGTKTSRTESFENKNFNIKYRETEPSISFQPGAFFRASIIYKYTLKNNTEAGKEFARLNKTGLELRYSNISKGSLLAKLDFIQIKSSTTLNSPVSFEMLEGLQEGENITWNVSFQRNLSENMQMNVSYDGRKPNGIKTIHTGNVQIRAFF